MVLCVCTALLETMVVYYSLYEVWASVGALYVCVCVLHKQLVSLKSPSTVFCLLVYLLVCVCICVFVCVCVCHS